MKRTSRKQYFRVQGWGIFLRFQVLLWMVFLLSCGAKGPLKLEPRKTPTVIKDMKIQQLGNNLRLMWNFPDKLSDKITRVEMKNIKKIRIYHADGRLTPKRFKKKSTVIKKLDINDLAKKDNYFFIDLAFKTKSLDKKFHSFAIRYRHQNDKAPLSKIVTLETIVPTKPIQDLSIVKENKLIKLKWSRPKLNLENKAISYITGYRIYRKIQKGDFSPINRENVLEEYYEDLDTGMDGEYFYYVSAILSQEIESEPSNIVSVNVEDVFPPDPPSNLISFRADDHIFLTWHETREMDLDFYKIFRKSSPDDEFSLIADQVRENFYKDKTVKKGVLYIYAVTAIDKKGNESQISNITKEEF